MVEICERRASRLQSRTSTPSIEHAPGIHIVDAVDQLGQRALTRAGLADDGHGLARFGAEGDVFQHGRIAIAEA